LGIKFIATPSVYGTGFGSLNIEALRRTCIYTKVSRIALCFWGVAFSDAWHLRFPNHRGLRAFTYMLSIQEEEVVRVFSLWFWFSVTFILVGFFIMSTLLRTCLTGTLLEIVSPFT
jgi:hypothetical protein